MVIYLYLYSVKISIFKLIPLNIYQNIQNIQVYNDFVKKIIEIKDGRYVSYLYDKTIYEIL